MYCYFYTCRNRLIIITAYFLMITYYTYLSFCSAFVLTWGEISTFSNQEGFCDQKGWDALSVQVI
jgi:hypothetical protein